MAGSIYNFSPVTNEYLHQSNLQLDPVGGLPLVPAFATLTQPPVTGQNEVAVTEDNGASWVIKPDFRGETRYNPDGSSIEFTDIGQQPDINQTIDLPLSIQLDNAKSSKELELYTACRNEIISGHTSTVMGSQFTYPTDIESQHNFAAICLVANISINDTAWTCKFWCSDVNGVWGRRTHTADQIISVGMEVQAKVSTNQDKLESLINTLNDPLTDTIDKVNLIAW